MHACRCVRPSVSMHVWLRRVRLTAQHPHHGSCIRGPDGGAGLTEDGDLAEELLVHLALPQRAALREKEREVGFVPEPDIPTSPRVTPARQETPQSPSDDRVEEAATDSGAQHHVPKRESPHQPLQDR